MSRRLNYSDFTWKKDNLYDPSGIHWGKVVPHPDHPKMWKIWWAGNGEYSTDFWNKTRAKDNMVKMAQFLNNMMQDLAPQEPVDAFKLKIGSTLAPH